MTSLQITLLSGQETMQDEEDRIIAEMGIPFIEVFEPKTYSASTQNWDIVQDSLGLIYIANGRGLLVYDGETFDLIKMPFRNAVRCLAVDDHNRVYCGGSGYFGYLDHRKNGEPFLVNLADSALLPQTDSFSTIENIFSTPEGIYFRSPELLIRMQGKQIKTWKAGVGRFFSTFWIDGQIYLNDLHLGICKLSQDDEIIPLPGVEALLGAKITTLLPHSAGLLIGTDDDLYLYKDAVLKSYAMALDDFISNARLFKGVQLRDGSFVLCTLNDGMMIVDGKGRILFHGSVDSGLPSNTVYDVYEDAHGRLWISTNDGFAMMEYPSPFSSFQIGTKTPPVTAIARYKGQLLVGTFNGLFALRQQKYPPAQLKAFEGITDRIWDLLVVGEDLFIGFEDGLYLYRNQKLQLLETTANSDLHQSKIDSNRIFVATRKGLHSLYLSNGRWGQEFDEFNVGEGVYHINEQNDGTLWLDVHKTWVYRIDFLSRNDAIDLHKPIVTKLDTLSGMPGSRGYVMEHDDQIYYVDSRNLNMLSYDEKQASFLPWSNQEGLVGDFENPVLGHDDDDQNKLLFEFDGQEVSQSQIISAGTNYALSESRVESLIGRCMHFENGMLWHGGPDRLIRDNLNLVERKSTFNTLMSKVYYQGDSLVSQGPHANTAMTFPFVSNSFRFTFGNTAHIAIAPSQYQYRLIGFDETWSTWSDETQRDFTNLPEGKYRFEVRAKNINGDLGTPDSITFHIAPPWHRAWYAYLAYILVGMLGMRGLMRWRSRKLRNEKLALEGIIYEKTAELEDRNRVLEEQKNLLSEQKDRLKEMDQFKSTLFANISHEFRTPLTLILGPLERIKRFPESVLSPEHLTMIDRNANRLLRLINQILDLSRLDSRELPLNLAEGNLFKSIRVAASTFSSNAADRNLDYQIRVPAGQLWAAFDRDKLEKIIYNLLSNAFKFTADTGTIKFDARHEEDRLYIEVADTGKGIPSDAQAKIFDRFYQVESHETNAVKGSGVGLALVKELIELMKGTIHFKSTLGRGTTFFVELPIAQIDRPQTIGEQLLSRMGDVLAPSTSSPDNGQKKEVPVVLVIEDNPDMRSYILEHLRVDYRVLEARNGKVGLKIAVQRIPDLIVTDLMMDQMDGLELCKMLKSDLRTSHIPVIILTAKAGLGNKLEGLETGADVYLTKPFHAKELLVQINRLIANRVNLKRLFSRGQGPDTRELKMPRLDEDFVRRVLDILEDHHSQSDFDVTALQKLLGMSKTPLHRKMKALTELAPGEFIRQFRIKRAAQILREGQSVAQTAYSVGFNYLSYFAKCFLQVHGMSPKAFAQEFGPHQT